MAARLKIDPSFASEEDRVKAFIACGGGCRATYFNHVRQLQPPTEVPKITLTRTRPPDEMVEDKAVKADVLALLRARFGQLGNG